MIKHILVSSILVFPLLFSLGVIHGGGFLSVDEAYASQSTNPGGIGNAPVPTSGNTNQIVSPTNPGGGNQIVSPTNPSGGNQIVSPTNPSSNSLVNPLKVDSIEEFLIAIVDIILVFATPIIVLFIMYAGFLYVTARGDSIQVGKAHAALTWAIVGGVIVLGAKIILEVIKGTITTFQ